MISLISAMAWLSNVTPLRGSGRRLKVPSICRGPSGVCLRGDRSGRPSSRPRGSPHLLPGSFPHTQPCLPLRYLGFCCTRSSGGRRTGAGGGAGEQCGARNSVPNGTTECRLLVLRRHAQIRSRYHAQGSIEVAGRMEDY